MTTNTVRDDLLAVVEKYQALGAAQVPLVALERILTEHPDPLLEPLEQPAERDAQGREVPPVGGRFAIQVRTVFGPLREVVVRASSLYDAFNQALNLPLSDYLYSRDDDR